MNKTAISMRANAMRLANMLARLNIPTRPSITDKGAKYQEESDMFRPPEFYKWPEIDVDYILPDNQDGFIMHDDCKKGPATWPLDHAIALPMDNGGVRLVLGKSVQPKVLRGKARRFSAYNAVAYSIDMDRHGQFLDYGSGFFGLFGAKWTHLLIGGNYVSGCTGDRYSEGIHAILGAALAQRYQWSAIFVFENGIKLRFGCSARGALELFKDRDKPEQGRRKSLLHWVRRHWRRTSSIDEARNIRQHLRGITSFSWRGMQVSIIPSEFELEKAA